MGAPWKWSIDLTKWAEQAKIDLRSTLQKIAMEAFKRIIERSPVDTGRFRANWGCSIGSPEIVTYELFDKDGQKAEVQMREIVAHWDGTDSIFFVNNLPYSLVLEYGRANGEPGSKQAPGGMVRLTVVEMQAWVQNQVPSR